MTGNCCKSSMKMKGMNSREKFSRTVVLVRTIGGERERERLSPDNLGKQIESSEPPTPPPIGEHDSPVGGLGRQPSHRLRRSHW